MCESWIAATGREDQIVGRGQRLELVLASSSGDNMSGHLLGEQSWFCVNLGEETANASLSVALIGETSCCGSDGTVVSFGKSQEGGERG